MNFSYINETYLSNKSKIPSLASSGIVPALTSEQAVVVKVIAYSLMMAASLMGNSLVLLIVYKNTSKQTRIASDFFIVNMACADILVSLLNVPIEIKHLVHGREWMVGEDIATVLCKLFYFIWPFSLLVSTQSLCCIAAQRFMVVFFPLKRVMTPRVCRVVVAVTWIVAGAFSCSLFLRAKVGKASSKLYCYLSFDDSRHWFYGYLVYFVSVCVATPLFAIWLLYTSIGVKLYRRRIPGTVLASSQQRQDAIKRRRTVMFVVIICSFTVCWMPFLSGNLYCFTRFSYICRSNTFHFIMWYLAFANSALNPVIYFLFNHDFRLGARAVFSSWRNVFAGCQCHRTVSPLPGLNRALASTSGVKIVQSLSLNINKILQKS